MAGRAVAAAARHSEWLAGVAALPTQPLLGLLTGNIRLGAQLKLRHYRLWESFVTGGFGDDHEDRNEIARIAKARGSRRLGRELLGREVLVIGDTPLDIACARAIGARCLAVATGGASLGTCAFQFRVFTGTRISVPPAAMGAAAIDCLTLVMSGTLVASAL